ncbi:MAG: DNA-binding response regulator [Acidobacteria bacterium]|nr:MAG: DNA-binding response regulator [Acidobacteriota bacterium]
MKILVVEDDAKMASLICEVLNDNSYAVDLATDGVSADELMFVNDYDLVVLDWSIPPPTGIELLEAWREAGHSLPILMLTGHDSVADRVGGLDTGADDYLTKPFSFEELVARVRSLLRRRDKVLDLRLEAGDLVLERNRRRVTVGGEEVKLSAREFALLEYLLVRKDEVVSRADIEEHVWDSAFDSMANVVDVYVHRLRKKIDHGRDKRLIHTVHGAGYVLRSERS